MRIRCNKKAFFFQNKLDEKFQRRIDYLSNNLSKVVSVLDIKDREYEVIPCRVTNKLFASRYKKIDFPIITYHDLKQKLDHW